MKLNKETLRKIIREEIQNLREASVLPSHEPYITDNGKYHLEIAKHIPKRFGKWKYDYEYMSGSHGIDFEKNGVTWAIYIAPWWDEIRGRKLPGKALVQGHAYGPGTSGDVFEDLFRGPVKFANEGDDPKTVAKAFASVFKSAISKEFPKFEKYAMGQIEDAAKDKNLGSDGYYM